MALINCPECGKQVSDQAPACIHCGYPLAKISSSVASLPENEKVSELVVLGTNQFFLGGASVKLYLDGEYIGYLTEKGRITVPIAHDCELTAKSAFRKKSCYVRAGRRTTIQVIFDRTWGRIILQEEGKTASE